MTLKLDNGKIGKTLRNKAKPVVRVASLAITSLQILTDFSLLETD